MTKYRIVELTLVNHELGKPTKFEIKYRVDYKWFLFWHSLFNIDYETSMSPELYDSKEEAEFALENYLKSYKNVSEKVIKEIKA